MEWDIFDEMQRIQEEMERMFNASSSCTSCQGPGSIPQEPRPGSIPQNPRPGSIPRNPQTIPGRMEPFVDLQQRDTSVIVTVEVPGMEKEDIDLNVTSEKVEIEAKMNNAQGLQRGRGFHIVVPLPVPVKSQGATATCKNGVLEITLPKDEEVTKSQNIKIK
ncbi:MAG: Hsp20 family protein [Theionarchaea archaeon]|nr:Hsp20 family protein [Theionarchaea archaeon]